MAFGSFELIPQARVLLDRGRPVRLGSRALDLLTLLVERNGEVVTSGELIDRVWPTTKVVEASLRVQLAGLRKALADGQNDQRFIANVPGRGYSFVAPVTVRPSTPRETAASPRNDVPVPLVRVIGRADAIAEVCSLMASRRLVTIVGPGGIGKTTVALAAVQQLDFDGCWFVDLSPLAEASRVPATIIKALGLNSTSDDPLADLIGYLRDRRALIVLDNCEHVIDACAHIAETLLAGAPDLHILATSREALRAREEHLLRLPALEVPDSAANLRTALGYSAIQLLVERAASSESSFSFGDGDVAALVRICRRLDGIPLAIELAAAMLGMLGLAELDLRLGERFDLLRHGRRTLPRHATLNATLEWSYQLLSEREQRVLRRLAVFRGGFVLSAAQAVAGDAGDSEGPFLETLASLVEKSLVTVDLSGEQVRYRLLHMTRAYAAAKLDPDEDAETRARHARLQQDVVVECDRSWSFERGAVWRGLEAEILDDIRAALDWALSPGGDYDIAVALTVASQSVWHRLWLFHEYRERVERALERVRARATPDPDAEMKLLASDSIAESFSANISRESIETWKKIETLAVERANTTYQMIAAWGLYYITFAIGQMDRAREHSDRFSALAETSGTIGDKGMAKSLTTHCALYTGRLDLARQDIAAGLELFSKPAIDWGLARITYDPVVNLLSKRSKVLWLQGFGDQAIREARACVDEARHRGDVLTLCFALADAAGTIAVLRGDVDETRSVVAEHRAVTEERALGGQAMQDVAGMLAALHAIEGDGVKGAQSIGALMAPDTDNYFAVRVIALYGLLAEALGRFGAPQTALKAIERGLKVFARAPDHWCRPEMLRARSCLTRMAGDADADAMAEAALLEAQRLARSQGALAWELRIATDLAELWADQGRRAPAHDLLEEILARFTEGFATADFRRGKQLLMDLDG